jgi:hypothetical protein
MRLVLRNQEKISKTLGSDFLSILLDSIKAFKYDATKEHNIDGMPYKFINIRSVIPDTDTTFQFAITKRMYDVIQLSYYSQYD